MAISRWRACYIRNPYSFVVWVSGREKHPNVWWCVPVFCSALWSETAAKEENIGWWADQKAHTTAKYEARKRLRSVKKNSSYEATIRTTAKDFHRFLRLHSRECQSRAKLEAFKAYNFILAFNLAFCCTAPRWRQAKCQSCFREAESFFRQSYKCSPRELYDPLGCLFHHSLFPILHEEIKKAIINSGSNCTPSLISYAILKRCPSLTATLLDIIIQRLLVLWLNTSCMESGVIRLIPKASAEEQPGNSSNFRPMALTPCVGQI